MTQERIEHRSKMWRWSADGKGSWHFITVDGAAGEALAQTALLRRLELGKARGFGSVKVTAQIGGTRWQTSAFPKKGTSAFDLPVKASVRRAEGLGAGDEMLVILEPV
ncbi:MAG: DUF1905 domain-containing protein [Sphingomonadaceae bacterium]|nr:DUF1905 domain-containing protein [Sphingomonadaceae bacterium]